MKSESQNTRIGAAVSEVSPDLASFDTVAVRRARVSRRAYWHLARHANAHNGRRTSRRKGQALLLAVLLMVFAALLGSTFVTVVALNLNQAARDKDKTDAKLAAQAGLRVINEQITTSIEGEKWRPEMVNPPPDSTQGAVYENYYTPFERAQGWALGYEYSSASLTPSQKWAELETYKKGGGRVFVKFPDPNQLSSGNSPSFLAEVTRLENTDNARNGLLQITVIGRSNDNDVVFARSTAYKATSSNGSPFAYALFTGNYDSSAGRPLSARLAVATTSGATISIQLKEPLKVEPGRTLMLGRGTGATSVMVEQVSPDALIVRVRSLNGTNIATYPVDTEVRAISLLTDAVAAINPDGGTATAPLAVPDRDVGTSRGVYLGGGVRSDGTVNIKNTINSVPARLTVNGSVDVAASASPLINSQPIDTANQNVVSDSGGTTPTVAKVPVPVLDEGGYSRYRQLTQFAPIPTGSPLPKSATIYGYGPGLYIDNFQDIERIGSGKLANFQLQRLWQRKPLTTKDNVAAFVGTNGQYYWPQPGTPSTPSTFPVTDASPTVDRSLEERGIRGWINPWEYLPRGVLIELRGDEIVVTRDDRSDDRTNALNKPDPNKAWVNTDGKPGGLGTTIPPRVYRMVLNVLTGDRSFGVDGSYLGTMTGNGAFNGVIFAEGNVRVRGRLSANAAAPDITLVSMGNIYIEGNISETTKRIALLAKKNVVVNPTQFVAHPEGWQNRDVSDNSAATVVAVDNASPSVTVGAGKGAFFRVGDQIQVSSGDDAWHTIRYVNGDTLVLTTAFAVAPTGGEPVKLLVDPPIVDGTTVGTTPEEKTSEFFFSLPTRSETLVRNVRFDSLSTVPLPNNVYLAWQNSGQMMKVLDIKRQTASNSHLLLKAAVAATPTKVTDTEQFLKGVTDPTTEDLTVNFLDPATDTLDEIGLAINAVTVPTPSDPNPDWEAIVVAGKGAVAPRRLAATDLTLGGRTLLGGGVPDTTPLTLTVSAGLYWTGATPPSLFVAPEPTVDRVIGSRQEGATLHEENIQTINELFYWRQKTGSTDNTERQQAPLTSMVRRLNDTVAGNLGSNHFAFRRDTDDTLPGYRIGSVRLALNDYAPAAIFNAVPIKIEATIYAQEGSWFVLPVPMPIKYGAGTTDINGDGVNGDTKDQNAATYFRRPNFHIMVTGNIAQNVSPTAAFDYDAAVDGDNSSAGTGAVAKWVDALAYPTTLTGTAATPGVPANLTASGWCTIEYQANPILPTTGFVLPVSPDLIYSTS